MIIVPEEALIAADVGDTPMTLEDALLQIQALRDMIATQGNFQLALGKELWSFRNELEKHINNQTFPSQSEMESWREYLDFVPDDGFTVPFYEEWVAVSGSL